ncbi:polysaccharide deacetylase family protein [Gillisia sp. CAL575]|uniref:polysaccharide deacetylase family protein n=1 Tax=Gillisia sp. CAL575 TaxID=985255 RepID=UPI0003A17D7F|nr:polysaccharide deacetylase family protein [Gillisia sp. CAL575]
MSKKGCLVISLDFELIWGVFDTVEIKDKTEYFLNTRKVIPEILELFKRSSIHATWASVGMLFNNNWTEWNCHRSKQEPRYANSKLSSYLYGESIQKFDFRDICFAPELIKEIYETNGQEMATHTYSHYYCLEQGQGKESFRQDLVQAIAVASKIGIELKSLVFPRNQIKQEYLKVCESLGIQNVRSNPDNWYWKDTSASGLSSKIARTADAYVNLGKKSYPFSDLKAKKGFPLEQKASRFLRPVEGNSSLRKLKLKRIKSEMTTAAKNAEVYHLWWHPHNFGDQPEESLLDLSEIIKHFEFLRTKYGFQSFNMMELGNKVI